MGPAPMVPSCGGRVRAFGAGPPMLLGALFPPRARTDWQVALGGAVVFKYLLCCAIGLALLGPLALEAPAQSSCGAFFSQCASRCKTRAPTDKNCVSDHCSPKLATCRKTGCWQE